MKITKRILLAVMVLQLAVPRQVFAQGGELDTLFDSEDQLDSPPQPDFNQIPPPPPPAPMNGSAGEAAAGFPQDSGSSSFGSGSGSNKLGTKQMRPLPQGKSNAVTKPSKSAVAGKSAKAGPVAGADAGEGGAAVKAGPKVDPNRPTLANASIEDMTNENYPDLIESFNYPNAEITDVVNAISELTGKNFIIEQSVRGKISIIAPSQITVAEAYKAFLSALAMNGFTIVPSGKFLKIRPTRPASRDSIEMYSGQYYPNSDMLITRVVKLKHTSVDEVNKNLRILQSKDGEMIPYPPTNTLIITDFGTNVEKIVKILGQIDTPGFDEQLAVVPVKIAKAKELSELILQIIFKEPKGSPGGFNNGIPRIPRGRGAGNGAPEELSMVAPDERTNALIVVGNMSGIQKVRTLVKQLDYPLDPNDAGGVNVYYVKYGNAEDIAKIFAGLGGGVSASSTSGSSPGGFGGTGSNPNNQQKLFGGDVKVTSDKANNSLVITASKQDYEVIKNLLAKIDIPRAQVFVEAVIMELSSNRGRTWDVNFAQFFPQLDKTTNQQKAGPARAGFIGPNLQDLLNPAGGKGAILGFGAGEPISFGVGNNTFLIPSLLALVNFLTTQGQGSVLSTPQLLALNNEEASIEVGSDVPIGDKTAIGAGGVTASEPQFKKASIKLTITPYISPDSEDVRMKIEQIVGQAQNVQVQGKGVTETRTVVGDRTIKSNIVVRHGDTAVLGGLMKDEETLEETKVPVLGDIPVLGWLFKSSSVKKGKVNLVVFLTPKIIRNANDSQQLMDKKKADRIEWLKQNFDGRDPYGKYMEGLPRAQGTSPVDQPLNSN